MNIYQWLVLAGLLVFAVNEIRLAELNNLENYSALRIVGLLLACMYVAALLLSSALFLFLKLGTL